MCIAAAKTAAVHFADYTEVQDVLEFWKDTLPQALKPSGSADMRRQWPEWVAGHDREIRKRLRRGDEDTLVNWLLFGTSFTREPRALFDVSAESRRLQPLISKRTRDLIGFLRKNHPDDRSIFARRLIAGEGYGIDSQAQRARLEGHLRNEVERVFAERRQYASREDSFQPGDFAAQMMTQSTLFRDRGLSLDTSILPDFAVDRALEAMKNLDVVAPNGIRRVALIGPGLDFADKNSGYDFYPIQTLQPFMLLDSLFRLELASVSAGVQLTAFDISGRVIDHIRAAQERARNGSAYFFRLPMESGPQWSEALIRYWKHAGERIGSETPQPRPPDLDKRIDVRTIEVRSEIAARITAEDFNVVTDSWSGPRFDLVIATNVFVYYDELDQSLSFASIERMLRPGGLFLTNNAIVELPTSRLRSLGFVTVQHAPDKVDHVFWYRRNG